MFSLRKVRNKFLRVWWGIFPLLLALAGTAWGAEFSAMLMVKDGDKTVTGKVYVQQDKLRQDFADEEGQTVTIVRPDKKVIWVIIPRKKTYMEMPLKARLPGQFIQMPPQAQKRLVGKDRMDGYEAEKYEVTVPDGARVEKQTIWMALKLGMPVKMVAAERKFSLEYKNIKEGGVAARLFDLPPGLQKATTPEGFGVKLEE